MAPPSAEPTLAAGRRPNLRRAAALQVVVLFAGTAAAASFAAAALPAGEVQFNRDVLPILTDNCFSCHGPDKAGRKAGLRLDRRDHALEETDSGARAIVPGDVANSELMLRVVADDPEDVMPPPRTGKTLSAAEVEILRRWIVAGAEYQEHWAFLPPVKSEPPVLAGATHPIDRFIRARLEREGIQPAPEAERATLLRRVTLDLTGLPPMSLEVDAFLSDVRPDAYERVVDRLLTSVHFGEKWARWWLDLAHYGDSDGIRLDDFRPHAWRYRQWVIEALNRDMPFDQFTTEQLAGDLLPNATVSQRIATGFLRNTISDRQTGNASPEIGRVRQVVDRTATTSTVWLGLSASCAQCHDHKFDPFTQKEFFQLYSFFNDAEEANIDAPLPGEWDEFVRAKQQLDAKRAARIEPLLEELADLQQKWEEKMLSAEQNPGADHTWARALELLVTSWGRGRGEGQWEGLSIIKTPVEKRTRDQQERLQNYFLRNGTVVDPARFKELKVTEIGREIEAQVRALPPVSRPQTMVQAPVRQPTRIHVRGDYRKLGEVVAHGTPAILPPIVFEGEPDRLDLARWLVSPDHPLTARVTVNRLWQELFGRGIVASSDNFGVRGEAPTHPELLDWLALEFSTRGWSIKHLLRLMVTSQTYRQSSHARSELDVRDPYNKLLARQSRLRLGAEGIRDVVLAAGGLLNPTFGGPSVRPPQPESLVKENSRNPWVADKGAAIYRRGIYTFIHRLTPFAQFANFDLPGPANACTQRERSNTPLQALNLLNDPIFVEAAQALAERTCREVRGGIAARIERAFLLTLARPPSTQETDLLSQYHAQNVENFAADPEAARELAPVPFAGSSAAESAAWVMLASVLLNLDELINRE